MDRNEKEEKEEKEQKEQTEQKEKKKNKVINQRKIKAEIVLAKAEIRLSNFDFSNFFSIKK